MAHEHCEPHGDASRSRRFEDELQLVERLIASGERAHALQHCVGALVRAPESTEWHAPLLTLLEDPTLVATLADEVFFGSHAARAFYLHRQGELAEAIDVIAQVHSSVPHLGFDRWLAAWGEEALAKGVDVDTSALLRALLVATTFGIGRMRLLPAERAAAEALVPVARLAMKMVPDDKRIAWLGSAILRRAARYSDAVEAAERSRETPATEQYLIAKGLALRGNREFDAALAVFDQALGISNDPIHLMEQFRVLADAGRWKLALDVYDRFAASGTPNQENVMERELVERVLREDAPAPDVPPLDLVRRRALGHGFLVPMLDATANGLRNIGNDEGLRKKGPVAAGAAIRAGKVRMAVSGNESASNRLALALMVAGSSDPRLADYAMEGDPLRALASAATEYTLWRKGEDDVAVQAAPPPSAAVSDWIEQLALFESDGSAPDESFEPSTDFLDLWTAAAAKRAQQPPAASAREWVAATVHPRMPVHRVCMGPDWVHRWQVAAVLGLVHSEDGWSGTEKRVALLSLLTGALDWPLAAAIRVAAEVALREPAATTELRQVLIELTSLIVDEPNTGLTHALLGALEMLPCVPKEYVDRVRAQLPSDEPAQESASESEPEAEPPQEAAATKKPWWRFWD